MKNKQYKVRGNKWKEKAVHRNQEIKKLKKRIKELEHSRNEWKAKCKKQKESSRNDLDIVNSQDLPQKALGHSYPLQIVCFCILMQTYGTMSLRSCAHCIKCMLLVFNLRNGKVPTHNSIRNWICKLGYYRTEKEKEAEEKKRPWALIIDESIGIDGEKLLLILGVDLEKWSYDRALGIKDVEVLGIDLKKTWRGEDIAEKLQDIEKNRQIKYTVSDDGLNLKKSYRLSNMLQISDCTHVLSKALEREYSNDKLFIAYVKWSGSLRSKWNMGANVKYIPPKIRNKVRFANMYPVAEWAEKMLTLWEQGFLPENVKVQLSFLVDNKDFILELARLIKLTKALNRLWKNSSFNEKTFQEATEIIPTDPQGAKEKKVIAHIISYMNNMRGQLSVSENIICCSDVIESAFGKLKLKLNQKAGMHLTEFVLVLANFGRDTNTEEVRVALESVKMRDLKKWKEASSKKAFDKTSS